MKDQSKNSEQLKLFRFKELKTYGDTEWIHDNKKKYRQVFEKSETAYIYAEIALYNKNFDTSNWKLDITLKCIQNRPTRKEICNVNLSKKVSKYDSIAYIREGWGNKKKGSFWKPGQYQWEVYVNNELIATKIFYIVGTKQPFDVQNYIDIQQIGFYEGAYDDINTKSIPKYLKSFSQAHTRYIFCQIIFQSILKKKWTAEFFIRFYTEQGDLKTIINRIVKIRSDHEGEIDVVAGFGSNSRGSWSPGRYKVEILFLDKLIGITHFEIGDEIEEGLVDTELVYLNNKLLKGNKTITQETFESTFAKLDRLVGLREIKGKVHDHAQYLKFLQLRAEKGFKENDKININSVFIGNPGTGKTTVARLLGKIYYHMGLLTKGHVHEVDRVDLIGEFIGQTAPKVKEAIKKAQGGILFIDEAYSLARSPDDNKDFGREAIEILIKEMSSKSKDFAVVVAGYPKQMHQFLDSNPGLKSRFKHTFEFRDYAPSELFKIAELSSKDKGVIFNPEAKELVQDIITEAYRNRDHSFGNARYVIDLIEKAKINLGIRIMSRKNPSKLPLLELQTIKLTDVKGLKKQDYYISEDIAIDEELLANALEDLNNMIGISKVKRQVYDLVNIVKYHKMSGKNVLSAFNLHTVFIGNPGTGKTTVARILSQIYKALGILERGHLIETDRQGLIAGFVGQTAIKTSERIDEAMGGVLFIDEAYALSNFNGLQGDYGNEAIQTILKRMEDDRGKFFLFVAGYPDNMEKFLQANPGLSSRFDKTLYFDDYSNDELKQIGIQMAKNKGYHITKEGLKTLKLIIQDLLNGKSKYFGNARTIRQLVNDAILHQNLRIASDHDQINKKQMNAITGKDFFNAHEQNKTQFHSKSTIGFKK